MELVILKPPPFGGEVHNFVFERDRARCMALIKQLPVLLAGRASWVLSCWQSGQDPCLPFLLGWIAFTSLLPFLSSVRLDHLLGGLVRSWVQVLHSLVLMVEHCLLLAASVSLFSRPHHEVQFNCCTHTFAGCMLEDDLKNPYPINFDANFDHVITDTFNPRIVLCQAASLGSDWDVVVGTGDEGTGANELGYSMTAVCDDGGEYIVSDWGDHRIQKCPSSWLATGFTTVFGTVGSSGSALIELRGAPSAAKVKAAHAALAADTLCRTTLSRHVAGRSGHLLNDLAGWLRHRDAKAGALHTVSLTQQHIIDDAHRYCRCG